MSLFVTIKKKFERDFLTKSYQDAIYATMLKAVTQIHANAVKSIQKVSPGIVRRSAVSKRNHRASKPGDPPNTDSGKLIQSIKFGVDRGSLEGGVGTDLDYGEHLEFGTTKMAARPWLQPATQPVKKNLGKMLKKEIRSRKKKK